MELNNADETTLLKVIQQLEENARFLELLRNQRTQPDITYVEITTLQLTMFSLYLLRSVSTKTFHTRTDLSSSNGLMENPL